MITVMLIYLGTLINDYRKDLGYHKKAKWVQIALTLILILINLEGALDLIRVIVTYPVSYGRTGSIGPISKEMNFAINTLDSIISLAFIICILWMTAARNHGAKKAVVFLLGVSALMTCISIYRASYRMENEFSDEPFLQKYYLFLIILDVLTICFYFAIIKVYLSKMMIRFFDRDISADSRGRLQHMIEEIGDSADNE